MKTKLAWTPLRNNFVLSGDGFYISYNPSTGSDPLGSSLTELGNILASMAGEEPLEDGEETALCYDGRFDILKGDFRAEYEKAFPKGLAECKKVFKKHEKTARSNWTTSDYE